MCAHCEGQACAHLFSGQAPAEATLEVWLPASQDQKGRHEVPYGSTRQLGKHFMHALAYHEDAFVIALTSCVMLCGGQIVSCYHHHRSCHLSPDHLNPNHQLPLHLPRPPDSQEQSSAAGAHEELLADARARVLDVAPAKGLADALAALPAVVPVAWLDAAAATAVVALVASAVQQQKCQQPQKLHLQCLLFSVAHRLLLLVLEPGHPQQFAGLHAAAHLMHEEQPGPHCLLCPPLVVANTRTNTCAVRVTQGIQHAHGLLTACVSCSMLKDGSIDWTPKHTAPSSIAQYT